MSEGMSVLVTGASGFIGRVLSQYLSARGYQVRALLRREMMGHWREFFLVDLASQDIPKEVFRGVETVWHLASIAHTRGVSAEDYDRVNIEGTRKLLRAAEQAGVQKFIYFSSIKATAAPLEAECVNEAWSPWPEDAYGRSKRMAEELVLQSRVPHVTILRPALVYGPGVKGNLRSLLRLIAAGWCPPLPDTRNQRSFVHVEDVVKAAFLAAQKPMANRKIYILTDERPYSTYEIYTRAQILTGKAVPHWSVPYWAFAWLGRIGDIGEQILHRPLPWTTSHLQSLFGSSCYRSDRIRKELGWCSTHTLLSSLCEMLPQCVS